MQMVLLQVMNCANSIYRYLLPSLTSKKRQNFWQEDNERSESFRIVHKSNSVNDNNEMPYLSALVIWTVPVTCVLASNALASGELCSFCLPILAPFTHLAEETKFVSGRTMREVNLSELLIN